MIQSQQFKIIYFPQNEDHENKINNNTKDLIDTIIRHSHYNTYIDTSFFSFCVSISEYTLNMLQNGFIHENNHRREIIFDFYKDKFIFNCGEYLNYNKQKHKSINLGLNFSKIEGHAVGIVIYNDTLEIIDSQYCMEKLMHNENYESQCKKFMSLLIEKLREYNIPINNIIHSSNIIPNIQDYEQRSHLFLSNQRNGGNCAFWSAFLMEIRLRNIHMKPNEFYIFMKDNIIPYIEKKCTLFIFITKLGDKIMNNYTKDIIKDSIKNITMFFVQLIIIFSIIKIIDKCLMYLY